MRYSTIKILALTLGALLLAALMLRGQTTRSVPSVYPTIQGAIDASSNGDTVLISVGTYFENINFHGKAIEVRSAWGAESTIIDGQMAGPVVTFDSFEQSNSILNDLTIRNGRGGDAFGHGHQAKAGGIHIFCSSPQILNCIIENNHGGGAGSGAMAGAGGIECEGPCPQDGVFIYRCKIRNNSGGSALWDQNLGPNGHGGAGGVHLIECIGNILACRIENNHGGSGAFSSVTGGAGGIEFTLPHGIPTVTDCAIIGNVGGDSLDGNLFAGAGGIHGASPLIHQCEIQNNRGGFAGGYAGGTSGGAGGIFGVAPTITRCIISDNIAGDANTESIRGGAGGVFVLGDAILKSCAISRNVGGSDGTAPGFGSAGGLHALNGQIEILYSTIANNTGGIGVDGSGSGGVHIDLGSLSMTNSIVWNNMGGGVGLIPSADQVGGPGLMTVKFSDLTGGFVGLGNVSSDPKFQDALASNYHLKPDSPCIDSGMSLVPNFYEADIDGDPRFFGQFVDMGADEFNRHAYPGSNEDLKLDMVVNDWGDPQASVRFLDAGDLATFQLRSPLGTFLPSSLMLLSQSFTTGLPPTAVFGYPELRIEPGAFFLMAPGAFEAWTTPLPTGYIWGFDVPMTYPGFSLMVQGFALSTVANNGYFAATEGRELRFK